MVMTPVLLRFAPRMTIAVRDWYRSTFSAPLVPSGDGTKRALRIRPDAPVTFWAEATDPPDGSWPFGGRTELVMQASPAGIYGFHGRVQLSCGEGPRLGRLNGAATCRLTICAHGYLPSVIPTLAIPQPGDPAAAAPEVDLYPAPEYPFPPNSRRPTLFEATVRGENGVPLENVVVSAIDPAAPAVQLPSTRTDARGRLLQVLDYIDNSPHEDRVKAVKSLRLSIEGAGVVGAQYDFAAIVTGARNRPETRLEGRLSRGGVPLAGALVAWSFPGGGLPGPTLRTRADGSWELRADDRLTLDGVSGGTLLITTSQGEQINQAVPRVDLATANQLGSLSLP